jgi:arsenate reductase-like glutaredoxin family protein
MAVKIYGIKNCNTMQKAFKALDEKGISYIFHDYKKMGIDAETLHKMGVPNGVLKNSSTKADLHGKSWMMQLSYL